MVIFSLIKGMLTFSCYFLKLCHPHVLESISPSSGFQPASPLKGEAVKFVKLTQVTASPLRGEAERSSDEGDIDINTKKKRNAKAFPCFVYLIQLLRHNNLNKLFRVLRVRRVF